MSTPSEDNSSTKTIPPDTEAQIKKKFVDANAGDGTTSFDQHLTGAKFYLCFFACTITMFLIGLDQTIVATILETVGTKFNAYDQIGWVGAGYMLSMSILAQIWGKLSIIFGRKYSVLSAIVIFEAGSLMCALAPTMNVLIGGRVLAGVGGGGLQTLLFVIISEMAPINRRSMVFAALTACMSLAVVAGPLIGGALTENVSWRWCFYINLPIGGLAFSALVLFYNPPPPKLTWREKVHMIDYVGIILFAAGTTLPLLALTMGGVTYPWRSAAVICMFVIGGLVFISYGVWNFKYSKSPIIPISIVRCPPVMFPTGAQLFSMFCFFAMATYISTYFQVIHGHSALGAGVSFLPMILSMVVASVSSGILIRVTHQIKLLAILGSTMLTVGMGLLCLWDVDSTSSANIGCLILPGAAIGIMMQSCMMSTQVNAPKEPGALILATSMMSFMRALGGAVGGDLAQTVYNASLNSKAKASYAKHAMGVFSGMSLSDVLDILSTPSVIRSEPEEIKALLLKCVMESIRNVFYMCIGTASLAIVCSLAFSNKKMPKTEEVMTKEEHDKIEHNDEEKPTVTATEPAEAV